jgi:quercetin dioxygenase-like cupin family protein
MKIKKRADFVMQDVNDAGALNVKFYPVITSKDGAPNFALRLFETGPDGNTPYHSHEWEHEVYILEGNGYIVKEKDKIEIEKDDYIFIEPFEKHQFKAGQDGLKWICVVPNKGQS